MKFVPHEYQERAIRRIIDQPKVGLFLDMGLGKTVITLTAILQLMYAEYAVERVLVIAPKRVAEDTWCREHEKWDHLNILKISKVMGPRDQRIRALHEMSDIYVISRDNVVWLTEIFGTQWPFDMVVIDELTSFKSPQSKRFRALRKVMPAASRVVGLTGTPSPNGLMDLWSEIYLLDRGERLGRTLGTYRERWFYAAQHNGYIVYKWLPRKGAQEEIESRLSDLCVSMKAEDYLQLPDRIDNVIPVKLSDAEMAIYDRMEQDQLLRFDEGDVAALSAAAVMFKLSQIASGNVYDDRGSVIRIHKRKLDALLEIMETTEDPVLVFYEFVSDRDLIRSAIPEARTLEGPEDIADWNSGKVKVLLAHPASAGYGLNLQDGGSTIVWYGPTWNLELYQQANARLYRQGQQKPVIIHHLIAEKTVDEQIMKALQAKDTSQQALMEALKERRRA